MSLEEINFIAEIIASVAVIASLIYVGREVSQNTEATQASAAQAYVAADNEIVGLINGSDNLADILHRGAPGLAQLQGGDVIQFMAFHDQVFISFQSFYVQWKKGALDPRLWRTYEKAFMALLAQPGQKEWWKLRQDWFFPEFRDFVEQKAASGEVGVMHPRAMGD